MEFKLDSERLRQIEQVSAAGRTRVEDRVAVEEPMEIRVVYGPADARVEKSLSITMRTPGEDFELAAGFLFTERILTARSQVRGIGFTGAPAPGRSSSNVVQVELAEDVELDLGKLERHFYTTSSCGVCGKASLEALEVTHEITFAEDQPQLASAVVHQLPDALRQAQPLFESTGGIHAAGLANVQGELLNLREDVGRHNAVDKLIGRYFLDGQLALTDSVLVVSGRASFELVQKALAANIPIMVAVGAPSSLAIDLARRYGMSLIGFTSRERFNIYSGARRIMKAPC